MIDLIKIKEKALLVTVITDKIGAYDFKVEEESAELKELAKTSGVEIISEIIVHCDDLNPKFFIGKGKAEELSAIVFNEKINVVIFSVGLSGTQQRNLEKELDCKIVDRIQLILDIFAQHAKSPEGKMQVELAQLEYLAPRLAGRGSGLSGLGGGVGTRGPGEQKLELDRRRMRTRITRLKAELEKSRTQSRLIRKKRREENVPSVVLVGYTNAGKTTLLNSLCAEHQLAEDSLFTTLDTLSRTVILPDHQRVVLSDTVGFLHNLPHNLIAAFKVTLEDVKDADLLIHVLDVSSSLRYDYYESVIAVLDELGCLEKPIITVLNKVDKLENLEWLERYKSDFTNLIVLSALKRENLSGLLAEIDVKVSRVNQEVKIALPLAKMNLVDLIYREGKVRNVKYTSNSVILEASISETLRSKVEGFIK